MFPLVNAHPWFLALPTKQSNLYGVLDPVFCQGWEWYNFTNTLGARESSPGSQACGEQISEVKMRIPRGISYKDDPGERIISPLWHWLRTNAKGHWGLGSTLAAPSSLGALCFAHLCLLTQNTTISVSFPRFAFSSKTQPLDRTLSHDPGPESLMETSNPVAQEMCNWVVVLRELVLNPACLHVQAA